MAWESNPFAPNAPESIRDVSTPLADYLDDQAQLLRQFATDTVAGQPRLPISALIELAKTAAYPLGSVGSFSHPEYGRIDARYVQFDQMADIAVGAPVGYITDVAAKKVSNDIDASAVGLAVGLLPHDVNPVDGEFGWVIVAGPNLHPIVLKSGESTSAGAEFGWDSTATLTSQFLGNVFCRQTASGPITGSFPVASLIVTTASSVARSDINSLVSTVAGINSTIGDTTTTVTQLQDGVTALDSVTASLQTDIGTLQADVTTERTARVAEDSALATRIDTVSASIDGAISAAVTVESTARASADEVLAQQITNLTAVYNDGISSVNDTVASIQDTLTVQASANSAVATKFTQIDTRLDDPTTGLEASATAITALDTRVTTNEGNITANATAITSLDSRLTTAEGNVTANASAISTLQTSVTTLDGEVSANSSSITSLESSVTSVEGDVATNATAITTLTTNVTTSGTLNLMPYEDWTGAYSDTGTYVNVKEYQLSDLGLEVGDYLSLSGEVKVSSGNSARLRLEFWTSSSQIGNSFPSYTTSTSYVYQTIEGAVIPATCTKIRVLVQAAGAGTAYGRRLNLTKGLVAFASSAGDSVSASMAAARAQYTVRLTAGTVVTGLELVADAATNTSVFAVAVDAFKIYNGSSNDAIFEVSGGVTRVKTAIMGLLQVDKITGGTLGADIDVGAGRITYDNGSYMRCQGTGFGASSDLVDWFGPSMAISSMTKANASFYLGTDGSAYFGGTLSAGTLTNKAQSTSLAVPSDITVGPFGTNGNPINVAYSFYYHNYAIRTGNQTGSITGSDSATLKLWQTIGGGSETLLYTKNPTGSYTAEYDAENNWTLVNITNSASYTYTDNIGGTANRTYRWELAAKTTFTIPGTVVGSDDRTQRLTVICTEE